MLVDRYRLERLRFEFEELRQEVESRSLDAQSSFREGPVMRNFEFLFAAWMVVWAGFFIYEVSIASRLAQLRGDIERLKQQLREP